MSFSLGYLLLQKGWLTASQIDQAFHRQYLLGGSLDTNLLELRFLSLPQVEEALQDAFSLPSPKEEWLQKPHPDALTSVPRSLLSHVPFLPLALFDQTLHLLLSDTGMPLDRWPFEYFLGRPYKTYIAPQFRLYQGLHALYSFPLPDRFRSLASRFPASALFTSLQPLETSASSPPLPSLPPLPSPPPIAPSLSPSASASSPPPPSSVSSPPAPLSPPVPPAVSEPTPTPHRGSDRLLIPPVQALRRAFRPEADTPAPSKTIPSAPSSSLSSSPPAPTLQNSTSFAFPTETLTDIAAGVSKAPESPPSSVKKTETKEKPSSPTPLLIGQEGLPTAFQDALTIPGLPAVSEEEEAASVHIIPQELDASPASLPPASPKKVSSPPPSASLPSSAPLSPPASPPKTSPPPSAAPTLAPSSHPTPPPASLSGSISKRGLGNPSHRSSGALSTLPLRPPPPPPLPRTTPMNLRAAQSGAITMPSSPQQLLHDFLFTPSPLEQSQLLEELLLQGNQALPALLHLLPSQELNEKNPEIQDILQRIVRVCERLGESSILRLLQILQKEQNTWLRLHALLLLGRFSSTRAIPPLVQQLLSEKDPLVHRMIRKILIGYRGKEEFEKLLLFLRDNLRSTDPHRIEKAFHLLAEMRIVESIPDLLSMLSSETPSLLEYTSNVLRQLTFQDFGLDSAAWNGWWQENKERSRKHWLVQAMHHDDLSIRQLVKQDLPEEFGHDFGYDPEAPLAKREPIRKLVLSFLPK